MTDRPARRSRSRRSGGTSGGAASRCGGAGSSPGCAAWPCARRRTSGDRPAAPAPTSPRPPGRGARAGRPSRARASATCRRSRSASAGTDWAPNSLTKRTRRGIRRASSASSPTSPRCQPSHMCESVPSSCGRCGATPPWAIVGRVGSACSNARFTQRSSTDLFHDGSCWATNRRSRRERRSVSTCGASATGSSWAHHWTIDGWWPSESTASRAWRTASRRIWRAYPHCSGKSCSRSTPSSSAARYSSWSAMWACTRSTSSPASTASSTSRRTSAGVASASPGRVGSRLAPFRNSRSPLIEQTQSFQATSRSPVRRERRSLSSPSTNSSTSMSVSGWSPSACGHHSRGRSTSSDHSISLTPAASGCSVSPTTTPSADVRTRTVRARVAVEAGVQAQVGAGLVGVAAQHAQPVELDRPGVVHEHGTPDAPRVPVPVDGLGVLEQTGDVAPTGRAALGVARHLDGQHVVVAEPGQRGDVEAVREEVALRIAEVGAVEPDVGLVEDAVERDPPAGADGRGGELEALAVQDRPVAGELRAVRPPVTGDGDLGPLVVGDVEADAAPAQLVVRGRRPPRPGQVHGAAGYRWWPTPSGARANPRTTFAPQGLT